jgi:flagellar basal-body rod modification protein FlgD
MSIATDTINNAANATAQYQATQTKTTGAAQTLGSQDFMNLMMKQLQYQDPTEPVSNTEFISQQAQFTQLSTTQEMNKNITTNNSIMQTLALVGKDVVLTNPEDATKTIKGTVSGAAFDADGAAIEVNGTSYPISLVKTVTEHSTSTTTTN